MPATLEAAGILLLFIGPGFLCARIVRAEIPSTFGSEKHYVVWAIFFSVFIHFVILVYTVSVLDDIAGLGAALGSLTAAKQYTFNWNAFTWLFVVLFLAPFILASCISLVWRAKWTQPILSKFGLSVVQLTPTAWDWFFLSQSEGCWIIAEMEDGSRVGGEFGTGSFASLTPHNADLFLEREYYVDQEHNFLDLMPDSVGVWISGAKIKHLHFYRVPEDLGHG